MMVVKEEELSRTLGRVANRSKPHGGKNLKKYTKGLSRVSLRSCDSKTRSGESRFGQTPSRGSESSTEMGSRPEL